MSIDRFGWKSGEVTVKLVPGAKSLPDTPEPAPEPNKTRNNAAATFKAKKTTRPDNKG